MPISPAQLALITEAHALGLTDSATARHAGVSLSSVKRYRKRLGLSSACVTQMRGQEGEQLVAVRAAARGLHVAWRHRHDEGYDLLIEGQRIDVKTTLRRRDGSWRFYLPRMRRSFHGQYTYTKNYAADCDVLALVALYSDGRDPDLYFVGSAHAPQNIQIRPSGIYEVFRNDWTAFGEAVLQAA